LQVGFNAAWSTLPALACAVGPVHRLNSEVIIPLAITTMPQDALPACRMQRAAGVRVADPFQGIVSAQ